MVVGRWLVGWCFPKRDLLILDDPIPDKLYCKRRCYDTSCCEGEKDVERGLEEIDSNPNDNLGSVDADINMTREVNRCELWKHMVHTLDKEPTSLVRQRNHEEAISRKNLSVKFQQELERNSKEEESSTNLTGYQSTEI